MTDRSRNVEETLPPGTRLEEFVIEQGLQSGGFGVTYLAQDESLGRRVAIKEYLPLEWAGRRADGSVGPRSASQTQDYEWGLARFLDEARTLARLDHGRIVRVYRVIEAWGTAYMVMEYVAGRNLEEALKAEGPWPEERVRGLLESLLPGVALVHEAGLVHRDIKPSNVMLRSDGTPVLIDFGAARYAAGVHSRSLTSVLTPGYAPDEQYHTAGKQGPWTDVYALGAVAYRALSGHAPVEAPARVHEIAQKRSDPLAPVASASAGPVSESFGSAVTAALAVWPEGRPPDVGAWRARWDGGPVVRPPPSVVRPPRPAPTLLQRILDWIRGADRRAAYGAAALVVGAAVAVGMVTRGGESESGPVSPVVVDPPGVPSMTPTQELSFRSLGAAEDATARIMEASGLRADFEIRVEEGSNNAAAAIASPCGNLRGCRVIVYDPEFLRDIERRTDRWGPVSVMAHEVAHHLQGHTVFGEGSNPPNELDADFYSGFILQQLGASLESALAAMRLIADPSGSSSHPPRRERLQAIAMGWRKAAAGGAGIGSADEALDAARAELETLETMEAALRAEAERRAAEVEAARRAVEVEGARRAAEAAEVEPEAVENALGLDRAAWRLVQTGLAYEGFDPGSADGSPGRRTRAALARWQQAQEMDATGYLTDASARALRDAGARIDNSGAITSSVGEEPAGGVDANLGAEAGVDRHADGEVFRDCDFCPELVVIPAGEFRMGAGPGDDEADDDEGPAHQVRVGQFALGRYEVARREFSVFVEATGHLSSVCRVVSKKDNSITWLLDDSASWRAPGFEQAGSHPVVCVSWYDARAYVRWLSRETGESYRLPSEAEWEYAARAGTTTRRYWGSESADRCQYANGQDAAYKRYLNERFWDGNWNIPDDCMDGAGATARVGRYRANDFGLHDVLGNVQEWTQDCWHDDYVGAPRSGTEWNVVGACRGRVLRGGSWVGHPRTLRSANRNWNTAGYRISSVGFRVARTLD